MRIQTLIGTVPICPLRPHWAIQGAGNYRLLRRGIIFNGWQFSLTPVWQKFLSQPAMIIQTVYRFLAAQGFRRRGTGQPDIIF